MPDVAPPSGGLLSNSNYIISSSCNAIIGLTVTIDITSPITAPLGASFQLNCYSAQNANSVYQQYLFNFAPANGSPSHISWKIETFPSAAYAQTMDIPGSGSLIGYPGPADFFSLPGTLPTLPAGLKLVIALSNDAGGDVDGVTFTASYNDGAPASSGLIKLIGLPAIHSTSGKHIDSTGIAPIHAFELNVVGEDSGEITLLEGGGGGSINYSATSPLVVSPSLPTYASAQGPVFCVSAQGIVTAEQSNAAYSELPTGSANQFTQTFSAPPPIFHPGGWFVPSQAFGAPAAQTDVFTVGSNGGLHIYSVVGGGGWTGPNPIGPANLAPAGCSLVTTQQFGLNGQTDVFLVNRFGQLHAFWKVDSGGWNGPVGIGPTVSRRLAPTSPLPSNSASPIRPMSLSSINPANWWSSGSRARQHGTDL